jgi:hypothetical protein
MNLASFLKRFVAVAWLLFFSALAIAVLRASCRTIILTC